MEWGGVEKTAAKEQAVEMQVQAFYRTKIYGFMKELQTGISILPILYGHPALFTHLLS